MFNKQFGNKKYQYSLDGGKTWQPTTRHQVIKNFSDKVYRKMITGEVKEIITADGKVFRRNPDA